MTRMATVFSVCCPLALTALLTSCQSGREAADARPLQLIEKGKSEYVIVVDESSPTDTFAVKELKDILKASTGIELASVDAASPKAREAKRRILVGKSALTENALGKEVMDSLKEQESLVTSRGCDLILVGGGAWGSIYAVYDFLENEVGYRNFGPYPDGERFVKTDTLVYSGKETRRVPAFTGFRSDYTLYANPDAAAAATFARRNRGDRGFAVPPELESAYRGRIPGHGLFLFVPPYDAKLWYCDKLSLKGMFAEHPEFYTMNEDGTRNDKLQLCFSNQGLRKLLTERVIEQIKVLGDGVYMVGATDHPGKFCHCPECLKLERKYDCVGGPLYDYILELCAQLKDQYPRVYVTTLAYRKNQSEAPPKNIVFPDNFIIDFAPVEDNWTVSLKEQKGNTYANLKEWCRITKHVSYWYYTCVHAPYGLYERTQADMRAMREAGVRSVGMCGMSSPDFNSLVTYVYFRLLIDPDQNVKAMVDEFCEHEYGAAAPMMRAHVDELEGVRRGGNAMVGCDNGFSSIPVTPEQLVAWQRNFDKMLELVKDDPVRARNVRMARYGLDVWTLMHFAKIRKAFPEAKYDAAAILARAENALTEMVQSKRNKDKGLEGERSTLKILALNGYLKDDALPAALAKYPPERIIRQLPNVGKLSKDPGAAAEHASSLKVPAGAFKKGSYFCLYDWNDKKTLERVGHVPLAEIVPNSYKLHKLITAPLSQRCSIVLSENWLLTVDLSPHFLFTFPDKKYEIWASLKFEGPDFDPNSKEKENTVSCDQVFLVEMGAGQ